MQPRSGLVQSADAQIFYLEYPSPHPHAQTLILLHGNGEDSSYWNAQIPELTRFYLRPLPPGADGHQRAGTVERRSRQAEFFCFCTGSAAADGCPAHSQNPSARLFGRR